MIFTIDCHVGLGIIILKFLVNTCMADFLYALMMLLKWRKNVGKILAQIFNLKILSLSFRSIAWDPLEKAP